MEVKHFGLLLTILVPHLGEQLACSAARLDILLKGGEEKLFWAIDCLYGAAEKVAELFCRLNIERVDRKSVV